MGKNTKVNVHLTVDSDKMANRLARAFRKMAKANLNFPHKPNQLSDVSPS